MSGTLLDQVPNDVRGSLTRVLQALGDNLRLKLDLTLFAQRLVDEKERNARLEQQLAAQGRRIAELEGRVAVRSVRHSGLEVTP